MQEIKLTQYSHGAGCGCKIAPNVLDEILKSNTVMPDNKRLIVGNHSKDDAAVYDLENGMALISTTDFFMPIVDDPYNFGRIASANAISDVYAMGGKPILAIAILGWPINTLGPEVARLVIEGSRSICAEAGIVLAGGHSIDSPEPIFGLAVNGLVDIANIKQNNKAKEGNILFLTKPIGVGILTTAEKKGLISEDQKELAANQMMQLNVIGEALGRITGVMAMTDVTGFGLLGHLTEMCEGSNVSAEVYFDKVPLISETLMSLIEQNAIPGGTVRNLKAYGHHITVSDYLDNNTTMNILADPQTSGGLLVAVDEDIAEIVIKLLKEYKLGQFIEPIGRLTKKSDFLIAVR
ncbi:MAG: selenide, water dikinase SelD [Saprospiraceae bacterium]|nr:selenide, water dikinase SelD [Saprospiraceae bacterium]